MPSQIAKQPLPLTLKEKEVLEFIEGFVQERGIAPTFQEIKVHFGFASFNSVQRYLKQLTGKRYIHVPGDNQKRAIQVLHPSDSYSKLLGITSVKTNPIPNTQTPKKGSLSERDLSPPRGETLSLPLLGRVAAGAPIESFLNEEFIDAPASLIRYPGKTFGLIVQGQSMIEDGIFDGDVIFVQKQTYAQNGETVVATMAGEGGENGISTVKRFYLHSEAEVIHRDPHSHPHTTPQVELRPANSQMKSLWVDPDEVEIQGIVVALLRRY